jgi:hypothetical protein
MKMTHRSPDERLRKAADCLRRLRGFGPDPMPMPHGRHKLGYNSKALFEDRPGPALDPVGGEFQPSLETGYPGEGVYIISC